MSTTNPHSSPPTRCPYCNAPTDKLPDHLPCDAVPSTAEVLRQ